MNFASVLERRNPRNARQTRAIALSLLLAVTLDLVSLGSTVDPLRPDLALLVVLYWSTRGRAPILISAAWGVGLLHDIATLTPLGLNAGLYCLTAWVGVSLRKRLEAMPIPGELLLVLLVLLAGSMLSWGVGLLLGGRPLAETHLLSPLVGTLCWPLVRLLLRNAGIRRRRASPPD
ncbi:MAG: rod shape-determining protein MreD [Betaproteobacteria bacterium]|jgi:rod shape-determining protein MreD|nr:rod shape-determining protein MreD [Betaproteobacteria bacterium]